MSGGQGLFVQLNKLHPHNIVLFKFIGKSQKYCIRQKDGSLLHSNFVKTFCFKYKTVSNLYSLRSVIVGCCSNYIVSCLMGSLWGLRETDNNNQLIKLSN